MCNYLFFIGIDISKSVIDISYHHLGVTTYLGCYPNTIKGFSKFVKDLSRITQVEKTKWFICFENTGLYSKPLLEWLISEGIPCREENALKMSKSLGIRRGKDDKIDSLDICNYVYEKRDSISPSKLSKPLIIKLKKLLSRRDFLVRQRQALKVSLKEQKGFIAKEIYDELSTGNEVLIKAFNIEIRALEKAIENLIKSDEQTNKNYSLVKSVIGIGPITGAYMIAVTENFTTFSNARKFACYCGVAPFPNSSGIRKGRRRVSKIANIKLKSLFSNCILTAIKYDPDIALYHKRKKDEGKRTGIVFNAIKNKLIQRVFAVINRQTPYVKIMNYK